MNISKLAYDLYVIKWKEDHITYQIEIDTYKNYCKAYYDLEKEMYGSLTEREAKEYMDYYCYVMNELNVDVDDIYENNEECDYSYNDYLSDNGYINGEIYVCYDEFMKNEYLDKLYIKSLLDNKELYNIYLRELECMQDD